MKKNLGFTLIELLVVIAIIAILATIAVTVFRGVTSAARDSKRKADIESIAKAYEAKYVGSYQAVAGTDFSGGSLPQDPVGGSYYNNLVSSASYRVCAALESNSARTCSAPSTNCYCLSSAQGSYSSGGSGGSIDHPVSCDPNGTLGLGLVGYWKMNESSWNGIAGDVKDSSLSTFNGTSAGGANTTAGKFSNAGVFDGVNDYVSVPFTPALDSLISLTASAWIKTSATGERVIVSTLPSPYTSGYWFGEESGILRVCLGASSGQVCKDASLTNDGNWHLVAFTYDNSSGAWTWYLDGNVFKTATQTVTIAPASTNFQIGLGNWSSTDYWNGLLDDVRIYNRALSTSEVSNLYNSGNGCVP